MKVIGIIVEYNPLQNGHAYQIEVARRIYGADYVVLVMTGNFNERGLPAIIPKEKRALMGINAGADLVIELPTCYSLSDLPGMALGAISIFDKIGIVDNLLFGSELGRLDEIEEMSNIMRSDSYLMAYEEKFREIGVTSSSRKEALKYMGFDRYAGCINNPNNLLGVTFLHVLKKINSKIIPITHERIGQAYLDDTAMVHCEKTVYSSATAVRRMIRDSYLESGGLSEDIVRCVPKYVYDELVSSLDNSFPVFSSDFYDVILNTIRLASVQSLASIDGMDQKLAYTMLHDSKAYLSFEEFDRHLRSKFPNTNLDRRYYRILTNQVSADIEEYEKHGVVFYASILAEGKRSRPLFERMKKESRIPIIRKKNDDKYVNEIGLKQIGNNQNADDIYTRVVLSKFRR